jgi:hypothetical protein
MTNSTICFPVTCPCCDQEYLVASNLNMIVGALATDRRLILSSFCAYHRVMWVANEIERNQIREYVEALHFSSELGRMPTNSLIQTGQCDLN